jgi:hypothetical protein
LNSLDNTTDLEFHELCLLDSVANTEQ